MEHDDAPRIEPCAICGTATSANYPLIAEPTGGLGTVECWAFLCPAHAPAPWEEDGPACPICDTLADDDGYCADPGCPNVGKTVAATGQPIRAKGSRAWN